MSRRSPEWFSRIAFVSMLAASGCQGAIEPEPSAEIPIQVPATDIPPWLPSPTPSLFPSPLPTLPPRPTLTPIGFPTPISSPTPEVNQEVIEAKIFVVEQEMGLPEIVSRFPIFNSKDPFYPWYRWNGGRKLFEPLVIPAGTVLEIPDFNREAPLLPEITTSPEEWQYKLAEHTTSLAGSSEKRLFNIRLGTERLNGTIIYPYQFFSIEEAIGPTTLEGGYGMGWGYLNGEEVPMEGGGICQIPSTLFKPAMESGMLIIERYAHMFYSGRYGEWDATLSSVLDFSFRNLYDFPVQIRAEIDEEAQTLAVSFWAPFVSPYQGIELESLYNQEREDGSRDAAVKQAVVLDGRERTREYSSHYIPKPE